MFSTQCPKKKIKRNIICSAMYQSNLDRNRLLFTGRKPKYRNKMAAPIVSFSKQNATLKQLVKRENTPKVTHKNVLCSELQEWPRPSDKVQEEIIKKLSEKLMSLPNIFKKPEKNSKDVELKAKIRSQLAIGVSQVFREIEKDKLDCVLVSGQATPAITVNHVITTCQEKCCPVLCLDQLAVCIAKCSDTKCFPLAVGFRKTSESDFAEVVSLIRCNTNVSDTKPENDAADKLMALTPFNEPVKLKPIKLEGLEEENILAELKRVFTVIVASSEVKKDVKKKKKKRPKKHLNLKNAFLKGYQQMFDFGKRTVNDLVENGKVQLVLVSQEIVPVLSQEPQISSLLWSASEKSCPVLQITGLASTLRPLCQACISVVGIKKFSSNSSEEKHFQPLIDMCFCAITGQNSAQYQDVTSSAEDLKNRLQSKRVGNVRAESHEEMEEDYSYLYISKAESKEFSEAMSKLKAEVEKTEKDKHFRSDFISLSGCGQKKVASKNDTSLTSTTCKPEGGSKKSNQELQLKNVTSNINNRRTDDILFKLDSGKFSDTCHSQMDVSLEMNTPLPDAAKNEGKTTETTDSLGFSLVRAGDTNLIKKNKRDSQFATKILTESPAKEGEEIGLKQLPASNKKASSGIDYLALSERASKKSKKALKRKLDSDTEGFLSFTYKAANIKTMTSNPNKEK
ncbi:hypothetical protein Btru_023048 [Bulinus truncatus]|nr:hypothetical protein Btru_023048 [Bulinus truncatus]